MFRQIAAKNMQMKDFFQDLNIQYKSISYSNYYNVVEQESGVGVIVLFSFLHKRAKGKGKSVWPLGMDSI